MAQLKSPGVAIGETIQAGGTSGPALDTVAAFIGLAERGPIGKATRIRNLTEFDIIFGAGSVGYLRSAAEALWAPGNAAGAVGYFVRTAHYTNIASAATLAAKKATVTIKTAANVDALQVTARTEGAYAHNIKPKVTARAGNLFTFEVYETVAGQDVLKAGPYQDVDLDTIEAKVNGDTKCPVEVVSLVAAAPMLNAQPALAGGDDGLIGLVDADYIGSAGARNGLAALNTVPGKLLVAIPGMATKPIADGLHGWCSDRKDAYFYADCPMGIDHDAAVAYRQTTIGANTSYGELWWPNLKVGAVEVPISPYKIAAQIRTDNEVGGAHQVAAGAIYGGFYGYTEPASDTFQDVTVRDTLDQAQVNTLSVIKGQLVFWGANTLDTTGRFPYSSERRVFQDAEAKVRENVIVDLFTGNNEGLWKTLTRKVREQIDPIWRAGGLRGATFEDACTIKIDAETNPDPLSAEVHGKVGLATSRPGLFFYFDFYRKS